MNFLIKDSSIDYSFSLEVEVKIFLVDFALYNVPMLTIVAWKKQNPPTIPYAIYLRISGTPPIDSR